MAPSISLALAIHNHQPVGNFGWVFAEVYERSYEPLVAALQRHPGVRLSLHYTGPLLEWLRLERPAFLERLQSLVARGQVELLGGGLYEPVLASLPERDRLAQLARMADQIEALTGRRPRGAWLAERVWEPDLPTSLVAAGYTWTILDDAHFRAAAVAEERAWGTYTTDDQGHLLTVFGTEQGLRYLIPFGNVEDVIAYLREHATEGGERVGVMGDDGEKFGAWPRTWEHCWGAGRWVERFFEALDANADWLTTVTPSEWLARRRPIGRIYVPTGSYAEMGEWALPADEGAAFHAAVERAAAERRPEARWLRGGFWRNFQVKYREVNDLHKQMLRASAAVEAMSAGPARDRALDHLHRGQSNDCYWHGLFGGIYISHMRLATYAHLIAAEDIAEAVVGGQDAGGLADSDLDGIDEAVFREAGQVVVVDLAEGAGIGSWDVRAVRHALTAVMRRRPEAYHALLRRHEANVAKESSAASAASAASAVASIHDIVQVKEPGLLERLHYDAYERRSGLVRFLALDATPSTWASGEATEQGGARDGPWSVADLAPGRLLVEREDRLGCVDGARAIHLAKTLTLGGDRRAPTLSLEVEVENASADRLETRFGVEWATTMLGGGSNPAAWWEVDGTRSPHDLDGAVPGATELAQGNDDVGIVVSTAIDPPADAWWAPIETISNSEAGFERVYQGSALLLSWPIVLEGGTRCRVRIDHRVTTTLDRLVDPADPPLAPA